MIWRMVWSYFDMALFSRCPLSPWVGLLVSWTWSSRLMGRILFGTISNLVWDDNLYTTAGISWLWSAQMRHWIRRRWVQNSTHEKKADGWTLNLVRGSRDVFYFFVMRLLLKLRQISTSCETNMDAMIGWFHRFGGLCVWDVIFPIIESSIKLGHGWIITSRSFVWMQFLICHSFNNNWTNLC